MFKYRHRSCGYVTLGYSGQEVLRNDTRLLVITCSPHHDFFLSKSAISECIQIPQLDLVTWRCY